MGAGAAPGARAGAARRGRAVRAVAAGPRQRDRDPARRAPPRPFELYAHTRAGAAAGLSPEDLRALAAGQPPALSTDTERITYAATRAILATGTLQDEEYAQAVSVLGATGLFELATLIGWYSMVAVQLAVFGLRPPGEPG